jgi:cation:H+ antiporter
MNETLIWQLGLLLGAGLVLVGAAGIVVSATASLAKRFGLTNFTVGFLLLGLATSTPELFVALGSVTEGVPQLSVGNLLGGSILLLSFLMGISSVIAGRIRLDHGLTFGEIVLSSAVVAAPAFVLWDGAASRVDGMFLIGIYLLHGFLLKKDQERIRAFHAHTHRKRGIIYDVAMLGVGLMVLALAARGMVGVAELLVAAFQIPTFVFGLILLSLGTNLPELALAVEASMQRKKGIAFADFLGSSAANTLILGLVAVASPFVVASYEKLVFSLMLLVGVTLYFVWALSSGRVITRKEGIGLLFFYAVFLAYELLSV